MRKTKTITISLDGTKFTIDTKGKFTEYDYLICMLALTKHIDDDPDSDFFKIAETLKSWSNDE